MIFYFSLFLLILMSDLFSEKIRIAWVFILIFFVEAVRFDVGYDFLSYYSAIAYYNPVYELSESVRFGPIHFYLIKLSHNLGFYQLYFIITSFITVFFINRATSKMSEDYLLSMILFLTIPFFFLMSMNFIRQYTAVAVIMYAVSFLKENKSSRFFCLFVFAFLLHFSSIIALPIYVIYRRLAWFSRPVVILLYILSFFSFSICSKVIGLLLPQYSHYLDLSQNNQGGELFQIFVSLIFIFCLFFWNRFYNDRLIRFYFILFFVGVFIYNTFQPVGYTATRISYFYLIFLIILLPSFKKFFKGKQFARGVAFFSIALFAITLSLNSKSGTRSPNIPYQMYFGKGIEDIRPYGWVKD